MAYFYIPDGSPDADEYKTDYIEFDGTNPDVLSEIEHILSNGSSRDPIIRHQLGTICKKSLYKPKKNEI